MATDILYNKKWRKFLSRVWLFKFIPFVDFVLAAGSLATGNVHEDSDFDVIVGVRQGRIFTVRMFCFIGFGMFGWWAKHPDKSKNRLCFNHFVTPDGYRLSPPYNEYWKNLYKSLVPVFGNPEIIQKFYGANADWTGPHAITNSVKKNPAANKQNLFGAGMKRLLSGNFGNWLEKILKSIQVRKIETSLRIQDQYAPRIIFNDNELEFHPHTKRIEEYVEKLKK